MKTENETDILFFMEPAVGWDTSLPVGNGRLGAMIRGNPDNEIIQINEESVWSGGPQDRNNPDAKKNLAEIRRLLKEKKVQDAQELCYQAVTGTPPNERVYQTAGELRIDFYTAETTGICGPLPDHAPLPGIHDYSRSLDMAKATAVCRYRIETGVEFVREVYVSAPDDILVMHITASKPGSIYFRATLNRGIWCDRLYKTGEMLVLEDSHGIPFCTGVTAKIKGGIQKTVGTCITVSGADEAVLFADVQTAYNMWKQLPGNDTEYRRFCLDNVWTKKCLDSLSHFIDMFQKDSFKGIIYAMYDRHCREYEKWYGRMSFELGGRKEKKTNTPEHPASASADDTDLVEKYCNFGRYLLISCSRKPGKLPATLQGLWNKDMEPPWGSKYTVNINTEMNYWPACMCGLPETEDSLFLLLEQAYLNGCTTAQVMYGCGGYVIHHNLDIWGDTAPQDTWLPGSYWILGAAWLATHIREHFEYTLDMNFLETHYYLLHEACRFFADFLLPSPEGFLMLDPSVSPENTYRFPGGEKGSLCEGCTMDSMILEHLFRSCLASAQLLGNRVHDVHGKEYKCAEYAEFNDILEHLPPPVIQSGGTLREWNSAVEETEPGHRHISHLYGLFPGHSISKEKTPELAEAALKTLEKRLANGGGHTGWSQAWILNFRAGLHQGNEALEGLLKLFHQSTLPNLLDNHPPFQIDGNFGALAAVMRMIVQSEFEQQGEHFTVIIHLLPALPDAWKSGNIRGIRLKGALSLDMDWNDGSPTYVDLHHVEQGTAGKKSCHIRLLSKGEDKEFDF